MKIEILPLEHLRELLITNNTRRTLQRFSRRPKSWAFKATHPKKIFSEILIFRHLFSSISERSNENVRKSRHHVRKYFQRRFVVRSANKLARFPCPGNSTNQETIFFTLEQTSGFTIIRDVMLQRLGFLHFHMKTL